MADSPSALPLTVITAEWLLQPLQTQTAASPSTLPLTTITAEYLFRSLFLTPSLNPDGRSPLRLYLSQPLQLNTSFGLSSFHHLQTRRPHPPSSAQPSAPNTAAYRHKSAKLPSSTTTALLKKARGVCRGDAALRPLCGFIFFHKKILPPVRQERSTAFFQKFF